MKVAEVRHILDTIGDLFPDAHCELNHSNAFELTIAVLLSAQCTDATVNKVTEDLFQKYKAPIDYISVPLEELEGISGASAYIVTKLSISKAYALYS